VPIKDPEKRRANHTRYMRERYQIESVRVKHRALVNENNKRVREQSREIVAETKQAGCGICHGREPTCLVFHHLDPRQKELEISRAVANLWNEEKLRAELAKCMVLCGNCHLKVHAGVIDFVTDSGSFTPATKNPPKNHKQALAQKRVERNRQLVAQEKADGCLVCHEKDYSCLGFHHLNPREKELEVSLAAWGQWSEDRLLGEISKCVCLCSNCHSKLHAGVIDLHEGI
jgi:hypothetical protein